MYSFPNPDGWITREPIFYEEPPTEPTAEEEYITHMDTARECVRLGLSFDRQREQHAIYLNQDHVDYLKRCAADARVDARKHIRLAKIVEQRA